LNIWKCYCICWSNNYCSLWNQFFFFDTSHLTQRLTILCVLFLTHECKATLSFCVWTLIYHLRLAAQRILLAHQHKRENIHSSSSLAFRSGQAPTPPVSKNQADVFHKAGWAFATRAKVFAVSVSITASHNSHRQKLELGCCSSSSGGEEDSSLKFKSEPF